MADVTIDSVVERFGAATVLHGVSLDIADGECVVLVGPSGGPSGCGKPTLLRMIPGLERVSDGIIRIGGRDVTNGPPKARDIAMVFQSHAPYPHETMGETIGFPPLMAGRPRPEIDPKVRQAAQVLGLAPLLGRHPKDLSGRQRVAMGRAIVRDPQASLFDEPLSNLDAKPRVTMRVEVKQIHERLGTTVAHVTHVTHDQIEAMTMADTIVVMRDGRVEQAGAPLDLHDHPQTTFVADFIGSPSMNLVGGTVVAGDRGPRFVSDGGLALPLPPGDAPVGRARDLRRPARGHRHRPGRRARARGGAHGRRDAGLRQGGRRPDRPVQGPSSTGRPADG